MRVAIVQIWHNERMGYVDRFLPAALAELGCEVHLVTSDAKPHFEHPNYREIYEAAFGPPLAPCGTLRRSDGVTVHRLPHGRWRGRLRIRGLYRTLAELRPDVVQGFEVNCLTSYEAAAYRLFLGYALFLEAHIHASVFADATHALPLSRRIEWALYRACVGRPLSALTTACHPISSDAADIAVRFFGMSSHRTAVAPLGTDTRLFRPAVSDAEHAAREMRRREWGVDDADVLCVYSGRLTKDKGPALLARAIAKLRNGGERYRGLFIGSGPAEIESEIAATPGCTLHPFVDVEALPQLYRAADIGVWPRQESTSQLDAAACGLPLVLSDQVRVTERIDGNGFVYREGDVDALANALLRLRDAQIRRAMGERGRRNIVANLDWLRLARMRLREYQHARPGCVVQRGATACP